MVELQNKLPRARVVYCSATSVSEPKNLGFMSRLGLWGPGSKSLDTIVAIALLIVRLIRIAQHTQYSLFS